MTTASDAPETRVGWRSHCAARSAITRAGVRHSTNSNGAAIAERLAERVAVGAMPERRVDERATAGDRLSSPRVALARRTSCG